MANQVIKKVLVPTDFSKLSMAALEYAEILLELQAPKFYLLHVLDKETERKKVAKKKDSAKSGIEQEKSAMKQLAAVAGEYFIGYDKVAMAVRRGEPYKEIVEFAQEEKMDLIVISTHGRTGIAHVLLGSVAEKVVRYSRIPVLSVKPRKIQMKLMEEEDIDEQLHLKQLSGKK